MNETQIHPAHLTPAVGQVQLADVRLKAPLPRALLIEGRVFVRSDVNHGWSKEWRAVPVALYEEEPNAVTAIETA
jgi:hypothetical protein